MGKNSLCCGEEGSCHFKLFYMYRGFACMCVYAPCTWIRSQKRVLGSLELELQTTVSCHEGAGNLTRVLEKQPVLLNTEQSLQPRHFFQMVLPSRIRTVHYFPEKSLCYSQVATTFQTTIMTPHQFCRLQLSSSRMLLSVAVTGQELLCCLTVSSLCILAPQILLVQPDFPELEDLCAPATGDEEEVPNS